MLHGNHYIYDWRRHRWGTTVHSFISDWHLNARFRWRVGMCDVWDWHSGLNFMNSKHEHRCNRKCLRPKEKSFSLSPNGFADTHHTYSVRSWRSWLKTFRTSPQAVASDKIMFQRPCMADLPLQIEETELCLCDLSSCSDEGPCEVTTVQLHNSFDCQFALFEAGFEPHLKMKAKLVQCVHCSSSTLFASGSIKSFKTLPMLGWT